MALLSGSPSSWLFLFLLWYHRSYPTFMHCKFYFSLVTWRVLLCIHSAIAVLFFLFPWSSFLLWIHSGEENFFCPSTSWSFHACPLHLCPSVFQSLHISYLAIAFLPLMFLFKPLYSALLPTIHCCLSFIRLRISCHPFSVFLQNDFFCCCH